MILKQGELMEMHEGLEALEELESAEVFVPHLEPMNYHLNNAYHVAPNYTTHGSAKRIVTEELYEDDLIEHGREYIVLIGQKQMLINGEKQSKAVFKKYRRLVDSLEDPWEFIEEDEFKLIIGR